MVKLLSSFPPVSLLAAAAGGGASVMLDMTLTVVGALIAALLAGVFHQLKSLRAEVKNTADDIRGIEHAHGARINSLEQRAAVTDYRAATIVTKDQIEAHFTGTHRQLAELQQELRDQRSETRSLLDRIGNIEKHIARTGSGA